LVSGENDPNGAEWERGLLKRGSQCAKRKEKARENKRPG